MQDLKRVAILGCTGSIGTQALDVCRQHADKLSVVALSAHSRTSDLAMFAREFGVARVAVTDPAHFDDASLCDLPDACSLYKGSQAAIDICMHEDVDIVLVSIVGAAGLSATYQLIAAGKQVALANKESLVVGGDLIMSMVKPGQMLPVDSEHAAIFQCYQGENPRETHCIWLTCSGGPFFGRTRDQLASVTPADALAHPTWNMGAKITIDSATLMNKGLERIEAKHLFNVGMDDIVVVIQRQSKIHSMVEFDDGSVIAHLGASDMRIPIQYAFSYPQRWAAPAPRVDFRTIGSLDFDSPDMESFRCLKLADYVGRDGGTMPCVLNAANEVAVDAFLHGDLPFTGIDEVVEECLGAHARQDVESLEQLLDIDAWARDAAREVIRCRVG
ncbi:1-deoxy-D-xylulose-5-phosphate reductoisomerase [Collinsella tanakaei]|uniref:1-deoxy-D-xylulose-5-phosphate reductoisomerase n=1 Tax=Collinsella tanakaei TaxID=626935 RepID=UPI0039F503B8